MFPRGFAVCVPLALLLLVPSSGLAIVNGSFEDPAIAPWLTSSPTLNIPTTTHWHGGVQSVQIAAGGSVLLQEILPGRCATRLVFLSLFDSSPQHITDVTISYTDTTTLHVTSSLDPEWTRAAVGGGSDPGWFRNSIETDPNKLISEVRFDFGDFGGGSDPVFYLDEVALPSCLLLLINPGIVFSYLIPFDISFESGLKLVEVDVLATDNVQDLKVAFGSPIRLGGQLIRERAGSVLLNVSASGGESGRILVTIDKPSSVPMLGTPAVVLLGLVLFSLAVLVGRRRALASR